MKSRIMGFNQSKLCDNYIHLNCNDITVLRTLVDMIPIMDVKIKKKDKEYSWIMYKLLVNNLPFVTQSESTMKKIVQKLIDAGLIERLVINQGGKYTYFRKTEKCVELEIEEAKADTQIFNDYEGNENINKAKEVLTETIVDRTVNEILKTDISILEKAIEACRQKNRVTNAYFIKAIKIAAQHQEYKRDNIRFINFKAREYDYDRLERKLLGWEQDSDEIEDYRIR